MKRSAGLLNKVSIVAGCAVALTLGAQAASCGGDDTSVGQPGADAGLDGTVGPDAQVDARPDSPNKVDSGTDAPVAMDSMADVTGDSAADVTTPEDSGMDAQPDSGVDAPVDAGIDAPTMGNFPLLLAQTYCLHIQQCCLAPPSEWDQAKCVAIFGNPSYGGVEGVGHVQLEFDGGNIGYNPAIADQCLQAATNIPCGIVSSTIMNGLQLLCLSAVPGTLSAGATGCAKSYDCVTGTYCAPGDGGPGTCMALVGMGAPCKTEDECSYVGNPPPSLYCDTAVSHTCQPRLGNNIACTDNSQCQSNICIYNGTQALCTNQFVFSDPGVPNGNCAFLSDLDGGGD